jgi:phage host-nuclease inhibitor protein Gam
MKKGPITTITEKSELDKESQEYRRLHSKIARARLAAERKIAEINAELDKETAEDVTAAAAIFDNIQSWAVLNKDAQFPEGRKSMEVAGAKIGFRTTPPSIKQVRGVKAEHSLAKLKLLSGDSYVRTVEEINKESLLADQKILGPAYFASAGLYVHQDEKFFLDPLSDVLNAQVETVTL